MNDVIEPERHSLKPAVYRAIGCQVFWPVVYCLAIPPVTHLSDFLGAALLFSTIAFWLFVAFVSFVRRGPLTAFYYYAIAYGVPLFSLMSLSSVLLVWRD